MTAQRKYVIEERLAQLKQGFAHYVTAYDDSVPFSGTQLNTHRETIALRRQAGSIRAAVDNPQFIMSLRNTLIAWRIGSRASRLVSEDAFTEALVTAVPSLETFESLRINDLNLPSDLADQLWKVISSLGVVENKAKLVAGTKTLHHLLPELVAPIDQAWTGRFFQLHAPEWTDPANQRRVFRRIYGSFVDLARQVQPQQYVTGEGWRTSSTKILDNALIGFCKVEMHDQSAKEVGETVYILRHENEHGPNVIGVYSSEAAARKRVERSKHLPEFSGNPEGFEIIPHIVDPD